MNFEKLIEWGAIILVAFLGIRWLMGAFSQSLDSVSNGSYPGAIPYNPGGVIAAEPYGVMRWAPYGYAGNYSPINVIHRGNRRGR